MIFGKYEFKNRINGMGFYLDNTNNKIETCSSIFNDATKFSLPYREVHGSLPTQNALRKSDYPSPGKYRLSSPHFARPWVPEDGLASAAVVIYFLFIYIYSEKSKTNVSPRNF